MQDSETIRQICYFCSVAVNLTTSIWGCILYTSCDSVYIRHAEQQFTSKFGDVVCRLLEHSYSLTLSFETSGSPVQSQRYVYQMMHYTAQVL
jgi:hypothetical protein